MYDFLLSCGIPPETGGPLPLVLRTEPPAHGTLSSLYPLLPCDWKRHFVFVCVTVWQNSEQTFVYIAAVPGASALALALFCTDNPLNRAEDLVIFMLYLNCT